MGFPLSPSDEELLNLCLNRIAEGESDHVNCITDVEVFKFEPWDLSGLNPLTKKNKKKPHFCYFFTEFNPEMTSFTTVHGYWNVKSWKKRCRWRNDSSNIGWKTMLMFYNGDGEMTNWEMHVYCLDDNTSSKPQTQIGLCKIFHNGHKKPADGSKKGDDLVDFTLQKQSNPEATKEGSLEVAIADSVDVTLQNHAKNQALLNSTAHLAETSLFELAGNTDSEAAILLDQQNLIFQKSIPDGAKESSPEVAKEVSVEVATTDHVDASLQNHHKHAHQHTLLYSTTHPAEPIIINLENPDTKETKVLDEQALLNRDILRIELLLLFVKGCRFQKEMIILLWMALDYLEEPMEENGADLFENLVSEEYILSSHNSWYQLNAEKVKAELDCVGNKQSYLIFDNQSQKDRASIETMHVSCAEGAIDENVFEELKRFGSLKTLLLLHYCHVKYLPTDLFVRHKSLAILDLNGTDIGFLPCSIGEMVHLRYLDVSGTRIKDLPETIGLLLELQTLILRRCRYFKELPTDINKLVKLRHLYLDDILDLNTYPKGIGALVNLRTLFGFSVAQKEGKKISELKDMNNLAGSFRIYKLEFVRTAEEAKEASLMAKTNLKMLELRWTPDDYRLPNSDDDEAILENLQPYSGLEDLLVIGYHGIILPSWIADISVFDKLVSISMLACSKVSVLPSNLEKLPLLESVELDGFRGVTEMNYRGEGGCVAFPKLKKLNIRGMLNLETWTEPQNGDYPSLVDLSINGCPELREVPSLVHIPWFLSYLRLFDCTKLAFVSGKRLSPSLQVFEAIKCPLIIENCSKDPHIVAHVSSIILDELTIQRCLEDEKEEEG